MGTGRAEFYSGTMRLNYTQEQNYTYFQNSTTYSQLQVYGRRNLASGTPSRHIHTDTYLHIARFKQAILASIYPKEMRAVLAMYLII